MALFVFAYYRLYGLISLLTLVASGALVYGTLVLLGRWIGYSLDLSGIAGLVIGVGATAWLNIVAILFLQVPALKCLWDYRRQKKAGLDPQFDPEVLGIRNADFLGGAEEPHDRGGHLAGR